jgi:hypothetical protein
MINMPPCGTPNKLVVLEELCLEQAESAQAVICDNCVHRLLYSLPCFDLVLLCFGHGKHSARMAVCLYVRHGTRIRTVRLTRTSE